MIAVRILPALVSALVLAAHFFRAQNLVLAAISIGAVPLIFVPRVRAALLVRIFLLLGSFEWVRTTLVLIMQREALGEPWTRMAVILSMVALFTLGSSLIFPQSIRRLHR